MQGFYVELKKDVEYKGPIASLKEARDEARSISPNLKIFHGFLKNEEGGDIDTSELYLVPKTQK